MGSTHPATAHTLKEVQVANVSHTSSVRHGNTAPLPQYSNQVRLHSTKGGGGGEGEEEEEGSHVSNLSTPFLPAYLPILVLHFAEKFSIKASAVKQAVAVADCGPTIPYHGRLKYKMGKKQRRHYAFFLCYSKV